MESAPNALASLAPSLALLPVCATSEQLNLSLTAKAHPHM